MSNKFKKCLVTISILNINKVKLIELLILYYTLFNRAKMRTKFFQLRIQ